MKQYLTKMPLLSGNSPQAKRQELKDYFCKTFDLDTELYQFLASDDSFYLRANPLRHPLIFYFGHTASFYINKLMLAKLLPRRINPQFESVFAVGVDEMSWDDLNQEHYHWPTAQEVRLYRQQVRATVLQLLDTIELQLPITWESTIWPLLMGMEHQRIHIETSSVLIRELPLDAVKPNPLFTPCPVQGPAPANSLIPVPAGTVELGKPADYPTYGWDNEYGHQRQQVMPFEAAKYLVSNAEYMEFVEADGYNNPAWWTNEGNNWRTWSKAKHPIYWVRQGNSYKLRLIDRHIDLPQNWPVEVNCLEAEAFCSWLGNKLGKPVRLPSEPEWQHMYNLTGIEDQPYWDKAPGNINLEHYHSPCPVDTFAQGDFYDIIGNVWQWTCTPIYPYPGFKVHPLYDDFTMPTFDERHNLFKGGAWVSTGNEAHRWARYAFRRHFFQYSGLRYIVSEFEPELNQARILTDQEVANSCDEHYTPNPLVPQAFPVALARLALRFTCGKNIKKALDIGCGAGRATFELASVIPQVTGVDFSARYITPGTALLNHGRVGWQLPVDGELPGYYEVTLKQLGVDLTKAKIQFMQADPANLKNVFTGYDLILAQCVPETLYAPKDFLADIFTRLNRGGILVLASSYSWLPGLAAQQQPGGFKQDGESLTSADGVAQILQQNLKLIDDTYSLPRAIRKQGQAYNAWLCHVSVWQKP